MKNLIERYSSAGATYFEIRVHEVTSTRLEVKDGKLAVAISGGEGGVAARALVNGAWGFASEGNTGKDAAGRALDSAMSSAGALGKRASGGGTWKPADPVNTRSSLQLKEDFREVEPEKKLALLLECQKVVDACDAIKSATFTYADSFATTKLWTSEGSEVEMTVPRILWSAELVAREGDVVVGHRRRIGATGGLEALHDGAHVKETEKGCTAATTMLSASAPPSGRLPVVVDPDLVGVFCHEALGHVVEGDLVTSGNSCLAGMLGSKIGSPLVNVYDDPTLPGCYGSFPCDDEGTPARPKKLVDAGVLSDYILNRESAAKLGLTPNGAARAEDFRYPPIVRMSNTYLGGGDHTFEELLEGIERGVYLRGTRGGQVDTVRGLFQFNAQEATLIENGELTAPLRDVSMSGSTLDILSGIDALGCDMDVSGAGICGKDGQQAPVGQGGPHTRMSRVVIGGGM